jgi:hypothetical protein
MKAKIHTLQVEIKAIEALMNNLNAKMQQLAMEEVKNLRFELDLLNRAAKPQFATEAHAVEAGVYA